MKGNTEIYINKQLCDLPENLSLQLIRAFYNPAEMITKDAQKSYSVNFPITETNVRIFGFRNVQEVGGKFSKIYEASIVVDGVTIFDDLLRLTEISDSFKGNFIRVFKSTLKDVLSDRFMNQCGDWNVDFEDYNASIKEYNEKANSECIFPLVMYGLFPKNADNGKYTEKDVYDSTVAYNPQAFLPSINCLQAYRKIFEFHNLNISGDAFDDTRLNQLYMSYKNPDKLENAWNYGRNGVVRISGMWSNYVNFNTPAKIMTEPTTIINDTIYNTDLLATINGKLNPISDPGNNAVPLPINNPDYPSEYESRNIRIPHSGLYKVSLSVNFRCKGDENDFKRDKYGDKTITCISPIFGVKNEKGEKETIFSTIKDKRTEIKIIKATEDGFDLQNVKIDMAYYEYAINQEPDNDYSAAKFFPKGGETCFIDPQQDKNLICGIGFGKGYDDKFNAYTAQSDESETLKYTNPIAIKGGYSDFNEDLERYTAATNSTGYMAETSKGVFEQSDRFKVETKNLFSAPTHSEATDNLMGGSGSVTSIVWLNLGDKLTVVHSTDLNYNLYTKQSGATMQEVNNFTVSIEPYKKDESWLIDKMNDEGSTYPDQVVDFDDKSDFLINEINLIDFLPSNVKANDWITNFNNAFNLSLTQISDTHYSLKTNKSIARIAGRYIDLTDRASVSQRPTFTPLPVPSMYDVGFTVNEDEQGYIQDKTNGGGTFKTWNTTGSVLKQTSTFSFNWLKDITFDLPNLKGVIPIPIISNREPFDLNSWRDYKTMEKKYYPDLAQRFWYKGDNIVLPNVNEKEITVSLVKNALDNEMSLSYHDEYQSILSNYFTVMTSKETHYTELQCYITHNEFLQMDNSFVIFNSDLYFVACIDQYNPITGYVGSLKLIRKSI